MENLPQIKLPFWETIRRSFQYAFINLKAFIRISAFGFIILIYEAFTGFPSVCSLGEEACENQNLQNISVVMVSLASIAISVAYSRFVILRTNPKIGAFSFGRRELKYLSFSLILLLLIFVPSILLMTIMGLVLETLGAKQLVSLLPIIPLIVAVVCARCFIVLPAIAVDNKEMTLRRAFALTKGNANKIFWGQALLMLPVIIGFSVLSWVYISLNINNFVFDFLMAVILMTLSFFDSCLKASYYSHIYQYFVYFWHHHETATEKPA